MENFIVTVILVVFFSVVAYLIGKNVGRGKIASITNELPNCLMVVVYSDSKTTLLEELSADRTRYCVVTEAFAGEPIKPKDVVRKIKHDSERKGLKNPAHGYPPMIKDYIYMQEA